jgi:hypothetical protein
LLKSLNNDLKNTEVNDSLHLMTKRCDSAADRWEMCGVSKVRKQAPDLSFALSMFKLSLTPTPVFRVCYTMLVLSTR